MPHIIVHTLAETCAALQAAAEAEVFVTVQSPPNAVRSLGIGYFQAMLDAARRQVPAARSLGVLDCGPAPGLAVAALKAGIEAVRVTAEPAVLDKLAEIATQSGARLFRDPPDAVLDLQDHPSPLAAARGFLAASPSVIEPPQNH